MSRCRRDMQIVFQDPYRIAVMQRGRIVEQGAAETIYAAPREPYTRGLLAAVPVPDPREMARRRRMVCTPPD